MRSGSAFSPDEVLARVFARKDVFGITADPASAAPACAGGKGESLADWAAIWIATGVWSQLSFRAGRLQSRVWRRIIWILSAS